MFGMFQESDFVPLSALQHWLFCPRQCALIHLEREWEENRFTVEGRVLHGKAHDGADETRGETRIVRSLPVRSESVGLCGICDIVEFHADGSILPVEYKRGKPKGHRADEVQLCAQAICLEEMLGVGIPNGALFYGENRRRTEVLFSTVLRGLVVETARSIRSMFATGQTPPALYGAAKCGLCSLEPQCQPRAGQHPSAANWFARGLEASVKPMKLI